MTPKLKGIDHVHVYVTHRKEAADWYKTVLGFSPVEALKMWAVDNGPLTLEDTTGNVHLALFERSSETHSSTIAFGATGEEFLAWKAHLEEHALELRLADHKLAYSLYFDDPFGNLYEITTYEHDYVVKHLAQ